VCRDVAIELALTAVGVLEQQTKQPTRAALFYQLHVDAEADPKADGPWRAHRWNRVRWPCNRDNCRLTDWRGTTNIKGTRVETGSIA
jgi:hypothetical protein